MDTPADFFGVENRVIFLKSHFSFLCFYFGFGFFLSGLEVARN